MLTLNYALAAIKAQQNNKFTASKLVNLLAASKTVATIANITQVTKVQTSAANKHVNISKVTRASVLLFASAVNYTAIVQRNALKHAVNDVTAVNDFVASASNFTHSKDCYSLVTNNTTAQQYLYAHYNSAQSVFVLDNCIISTAQAAAYCTASAAKAMLQTSNTQINVSNNITHNIIVRTVKLQNIVRVAALKQIIN